MRETRSSGSVEGVMSNRDPYSDSIVLTWDSERWEQKLLRQGTRFMEHYN
jgi:hypothetical protein